MPYATMRERAVALAQEGFRVFKLIPGSKLPAIEAFYAAASNDPDKVSRVWTGPDGQDSEPHNIGIATGEGLLVVDVDDKEGKAGSASLLDLVVDDGLNTATKTAISPTGSRHLFYSCPPGRLIRNSAGKVASGIDIRAHHGYVVGAGSETEKGCYNWLNDAPILPAPEWLLEKAGAAKTPESTSRTPVGDLDTDYAVESAARYLLERAPLAIEGEAGDATTYRVACAVLDLGLSQETALNLLLTHWNERNDPPWDEHDLEKKVENAWAYRLTPPGSTNPQNEFDKVDLPGERDAKAGTNLTWLDPNPIRSIPVTAVHKRDWIIDRMLCRGFVTGLVSPGGVGKTTFTLLHQQAAAEGDGSLIGRTIRKKASFWFWCQEDDMQELTRRIVALRTHHQRAAPEGLFVNSGVDTPLTLAKRSPGGALKPHKEIVDAIVDRIREKKIDVFAFDPLVEFHEGDENNNVEMKTVWATARDIAVRGNCAVLVVTHTRKPQEASSDGYVGNTDMMRGASSQTGVLRLSFTLYTMSTQQAEDYGVAEEDRHRYVRLDEGKTNLTLNTGEPLWFKRVSVPVTTVEGEVEEIGTLEVADLRRDGAGGDGAGGAFRDVIPDLAEVLATDTFPEGKWHRLEDLLPACSDEVRHALRSNDVRSRTLRAGMALHHAGEGDHENYFEIPWFGRTISVYVPKQRSKKGWRLKMSCKEPNG